MSMLDGFFSKGGFKGARCKTLLKLTIPRIKLLRNRRENQLKQMRRDIAKLLENGQEATARIRVEHIIREENTMAAQEIIELFCELVAVRLPVIETQRECPIDLKEAISSICFAAPRSADLPELQQVQMLFAAKYGKEFVAAASELMPDCGVNRQIIELLSVRAPSVEAKLKLLKEIAEEHELDWDPAATESEFLKPHEDLLNGPNQFVSGSTLPLPKEKYEDSKAASNPVKESDEESDTDAGLDSLDLPEVPRVSVRPSSDTRSAPKTLPHQPLDNLESDDEVTIPSPRNKDPSHVSHVKPTVDGLDPSLPYLYSPDASFAVKENKQSIPFSSSPSSHSVSSPVKMSDPALSSQNKSEVNVDSPSVPYVSSLSGNENFTDVNSPPMPSASFSSKQYGSSPFTPEISAVSVDLQDVLAAAHAAAESAEKAAAAARAAASLAQVRITELISKRNDRTSDGSGDVFQREGSGLVDGSPERTFDQRNSFTHVNQIPGYEPAWTSGSATHSSHDVPKVEVESGDSYGRGPEHQPHHQPERSTSLEDDPYYSYPNLFSTQDRGASN